MKLNLEFPSENCYRISTGGFVDVYLPDFQVYIT